MSDWLLNFVKEREGFRSEAYLDAVGIATIGWGSTRGVKLGDTITREGAEELLKHELSIFKRYVEKFSVKHGYNWTGYQVSALTSFSFNLGRGSIKQVTKNGTRTNEQIAQKMLLYYNAGGRKLRGLELRRIEESRHFQSGDMEY